MDEENDIQGDYSNVSIEEIFKNAEVYAKRFEIDYRRISIRVVDIILLRYRKTIFYVR